ncbi:MAG TPA: hypothetical protein VK961_03025 [Chthoniobacter sp.]|nr:hypothetical protein [Chthoniobacter sp.]
MRFPLPIAFLAALALVGCATPEEKQAKLVAKAEKQRAALNTRASEQRRMLAIENHEVNSNRGAQILEYSPDKSFDPGRATAAASHGYSTNKASTKNFYSDKQMRLDTYQARAFYDAKPNQAAQREFATKEAPTKGKFLNLFAKKTASTKTASTKEAWDANKSAATRPLADGRRPYLGPESKKFNTQISAAEMADWRHGGETVGYTDGTVERMGSMKQLSIEDVRELLNKSK